MAGHNIRSVYFSAFLLISTLLTQTLATCPSLATVEEQLQPHLSSSSSISSSIPQRWSQYGAPQPKIVVNIAAEQDVATTVQYCNQNNLTFLAQNGGNGWADTFTLGECGVLINIGQLTGIEFSADRTEARVQSGVQVEQMVNAAYGNNTRFANPTCNCLGYLGATLGGGLTRVAGLYGWGVDQLLSANVVLASGQMLEVSNTSHPDLWWALGGAAPNFGIVTSAVVRTFPHSMAENTAWQAMLTYPEEKFEDVISAINSLNLPNQTTAQVDFLISNSGQPDYNPTIMAILFYPGNATEAKATFAPLFNLGPTSSNASVIPYTQWNAWGDSFCSKGDRKPTYGLSIKDNLDPSTWGAVLQEYKSFVSTYGSLVVNSSILAENYPTLKVRQIGPNKSAFSVRDYSTHVAIIPWYANASFDPIALAWGEKVRGLLRSTGEGDSVGYNATYINFAHGDEPIQDVYGPSNLKRLESLKARYDPQNRFNQWYPLTSN